MSRLATLKADEEAGNPRPELIPPELDAGHHLIDYLFEVGPSIAGEPLTFVEIGAWASQTGRVLNTWEPVALRRISLAYLAELQAAQAPGRLPPGAAPRPPVSNQAIHDALKAGFERFERQDAKYAPPLREARPPRPPRPPRTASRNRPVRDQGFSKPVSEGE